MIGSGPVSLLALLAAGPRPLLQVAPTHRCCTVLTSTEPGLPCSRDRDQQPDLGRPVEKFAQVGFHTAPTMPHYCTAVGRQVKQGLEAQLTDELPLTVGQIVKITHIIDKDWYRSVSHHSL